MAIAQKSVVIFESVKNERTYQFIIPAGAPFGEIFDVVFEMLTASDELSKQAMENAKKAIEEAKDKQTTA